MTTRWIHYPIVMKGGPYKSIAEVKTICAVRSTTLARVDEGLPDATPREDEMDDF